MTRVRKTKTLPKPATTLSNIPQEIIISILECLDKKSLATFRLVNKAASDLGAIRLFHEAEFNRQSIDKFPSHYLPYLKRIRFSPKLFKYEIGFIIRDCTLTLKEISLTLQPDLFILNELAKCRNLEEMDLELYGRKREWDRLNKQFFEEI